MLETPEQRSRIMRAVRSRDTAPELLVRKLLRSLGFTGYRLHRKELPGKPDIAFISRKKAIFIHGCFWHGHNCKQGIRKPKSNQAYWIPKIERTRQRDNEHIIALENLGWLSLVLWECELHDVDALAKHLTRFMDGNVIKKVVGELYS